MAVNDLLVQPSLSADVDPGAITNRVKRVRRWRRRPADVPPRSPRRYRADRSVQGKGAVVRMVSAPEEQWKRIDAEATRLRISRSELIRRATDRFIADGSGATGASSTSTPAVPTPNTNRTRP